MNQPRQELKLDPKPVTQGVYTYVGSGADSPRKINFMGKQEFVRGEAVTVTDPAVLAKLVNNPCFAAGEVKQQDIIAIDDAGAEKEKQTKAKDAKVQSAFGKKYNKE